jgi:hypothetical protein
MQEFDQQIAAPRSIAQEGNHIRLRRWHDLAALRDRTAAATAGAGMAWLVGWP